MKKQGRALALMLAFILAAQAAACAGGQNAPAESTQAGSSAEESAAVGDVVEGFEVKEIRPFDMIATDIVLFEHQKTGAKLLYFANDDTNRVYDLTFLTQAIDDTGLPHVFEHATLNGSAKYPSSAQSVKMNTVRSVVIRLKNTA